MDQYNNKIYQLDLDEVLRPGTTPSRVEQSKLFKNLAQKVRENAKLFAQIEANTRNMEADKVIKYDIELIVKEFEYYSEIRSAETSPKCGMCQI